MCVRAKCRFSGTLQYHFTLTPATAWLLFTDNNIGDGGAIQLVDSLANHTALTLLKLEGIHSGACNHKNVDLTITQMAVSSLTLTLRNGVPVADNRLSMGVKAYVRSERARALQQTTLYFIGLFPKGI